MDHADSTIVATLREAMPDLVAVYRFGSTASGESHGRSDVDVAYLSRPGLRHALDARDRFDLQGRLGVALHRDVDLVDLAAASTVLRMQVIGRGLLLAEFDATERELFEDYVFSSYARLNEERRGILERVQREGRVYDG